MILEEYLARLVVSIAVQNYATFLLGSSYKNEFKTFWDLRKKQYCTVLNTACYRKYTLRYLEFNKISKTMARTPVPPVVASRGRRCEGPLREGRCHKRGHQGRGCVNRGRRGGRTRTRQRCCQYRRVEGRVGHGRARAGVCVCV